MTKTLLKKLSAFCAFFLIFNSSFAQDFTWIKGSNLTGQNGHYGQMGVPQSTTSPGARDGAVTWTDASGNFWLFGGDGYDYIGNYGLLSDLWKYSVTTNQWTYMKGSDFVAQLSDYGPLGVSTATAKPGGRSSCATWVDVSGNLWLFGGYGHSSAGIGYLNDLWKYNPNTNEWTYANGSTVAYSPGTYGTIGIGSNTNTPGGRMGALSWVGPNGNLWVSSGLGTTTSSLSTGHISDVWQYDISTNAWTWMKGSTTLNLNGNYGTLGTTAISNNPGSRMSACGWVDGSGNFWMFGGDGWDATTTSASALLNDLWKYNMATNQWTWVGGTNTNSQLGLYGTQGISSSTNMPGSRSGAISWKDAVGNLWLFAGEGFPISGTTAGSLNDLWRYNLNTGEWIWTKGSAILNQLANYGTQNVAAFTNNPGARSIHAGWIDSQNDLYFFGGYGYTSSGSAGDLNDLWKYTNCFISPITMTITARDSVICAGESTSLTVVGSTNYLWLNNTSILSYNVIAPSISTTYTVLTADSKGCRYSAVFTETVLACTAMDKTSNAVEYSLFPNPANGEFTIRINEADLNSEFTVFNALGQMVYSELLANESTKVKPNLVRGIYYYQLKTRSKSSGSGKLVMD
ncbi:hypothetical protein CNR22_19535 [Sphingobacteriaceae bacterium]|nr:hypothetical protein CNR22_19535 [Sphingobacteriaceae bacterium]